MRYGRISSLLVPVMAVVAWVGVKAQTEAPVFNVGRTPTAEEIQAWNLTSGPDGKDLPPGKGTAKEGAGIYAQKCAACHGPNGAGPSNTLVGGLDTLKPPFLNVEVTIAAWPFATAIWSTIRSSMPAGAPGTLTADETYALTAYLLSRSGIIQESDVMDAQSLPKVTMPRRNNYVPPALEDINRLRCRAGTCP